MYRLRSSSPRPVSSHSCGSSSAPGGRWSSQCSWRPALRRRRWKAWSSPQRCISFSRWSSGGRDHRRAALAACAGLGAVLLGAVPWRLWLHHHGIANQSTSRLSDPGFLIHHVARIPVAARLLGCESAGSARMVVSRPALDPGRSATPTVGLATRCLRGGCGGGCAVRTGPRVLDDEAGVPLQARHVCSTGGDRSRPPAGRRDACARRLNARRPSS